jgi:Adenylate and Guanylate cyclase catalytic domain
MNMASRIETTGKKDKIHLSRDTAKLLRPSYVIKREDIVTLKGKGEQETYWFNFSSRTSDGSHSSSRDSYFNSNSSNPDELTEIGTWEGTNLDGILGKTMIDSTMQSLILWNVDTLKPMLRSIIAKRAATGATESEIDFSVVEYEDVKHEVKVVIEMDKFDAEVASKVTLIDATFPLEAESELCSYVAAIASGYPKNPCKIGNIYLVANLYLFGTNVPVHFFTVPFCSPFV